MAFDQLYHGRRNWLVGPRGKWGLLWLRRTDRHLLLHAGIGAAKKGFVLRLWGDKHLHRRFLIMPLGGWKCASKER